MPPLLLTLLLALCQLPLILSQAAAQNRKMGSEAVVPLRTHSIAAPYVDSSLQNKFWDFGGHTIIDTGGHIRLTQDRPHQSGWLWSRSPLVPDNFEIIVEFDISGKHKANHGDGFAVWLTHERRTPGPIFGNKNQWHGMGLFLDTFANSKHDYTMPRVSLMMNMGNRVYDKGTDGAATEDAGCSADYRDREVATKMKITNVKGVYFEVELHYKDWDHWESCFKLSNVTMPEHPYLGFTALTGLAHDNHDIISVQSSNLVFRQRTAEELRLAQEAAFETKAEGKKGSASQDSARDSHLRQAKNGPGFFAGLFGGLFTLIKWALILAAIAGAVLAGLSWQRKRDAKRF